MKVAKNFIFGVSILCFIPQEISSNAQNDKFQLRHRGPEPQRGPDRIQQNFEERSVELSRRRVLKRKLDNGVTGPATGASGDFSSASSDGNTHSMKTTLKSILKRIPQINFYSSIPNAIGVIGQGYTVLEVLSNAMGTPLPYFIGALPVTLFGIAMIFVPDLTTLSLFGFYPNGAGDHDPLAAFPPAPNLDGVPDVDFSLSPDNIPPRIIPVSKNQNQVNQLQAFPTHERLSFVGNADLPINSEGFQAPRSKIGGGRAPVRRPHFIPLNISPIKV